MPRHRDWPVYSAGRLGAGELRRRARRLDPPRQVLIRPRGERPLAREAALRPGQTPARLIGTRLGDRRKQAEVDVHRLERARAGVDRFDVAAGDVVQERADRSCWRRGLEIEAKPLGGGEPAGDQADRRALDIAFAAGDLAGEAQAWARLQPQPGVNKARRIEIGVTMHPAEPGELRLFEPRDQTEDATLLAVFELGLEADDVEEGAERIVLPELDN